MNISYSNKSVYFFCFEDFNSRFLKFFFLVKLQKFQERIEVPIGIVYFSGILYYETCHKFNTRTQQNSLFVFEISMSFPM